MFRYLPLIIFSIIVHVCCRSKTSQQASTAPDLDYLNRLIEHSPFVDSLYYVRAHYFYDHEGYAEAVRDLDYAIKLDSLKPHYYHLLADAHMEQGQSYEGLASMIKASNLFPTRIPTLLKLCEYQNLLKQEDKSLATISRILTINPLESEAYFMAGINYRDINDTLNAIANLQKATTYDDQLIDGWIILSQLLQLKDPGQARQCIENALRADTSNIQTLHSYAEFFHETDPAKAIATYQRIIEIDPQYQDAFLNSGILYFSIDSFAKALEHIDIACRQSPQEPTYVYYRGVVKEALNDLEGARLDYNQALRLKADYTAAKEALDKLGH